MKKLLIATTALVASAGLAAAYTPETLQPQGGTFDPGSAIQLSMTHDGVNGQIVVEDNGATTWTAHLIDGEQGGGLEIMTGDTGVTIQASITQQVQTGDPMDGARGLYNIESASATVDTGQFHITDETGADYLASLSIDIDPDTPQQPAISMKDIVADLTSGFIVEQPGAAGAATWTVTATLDYGERGIAAPGSASLFTTNEVRA